MQADAPDGIPPPASAQDLGHRADRTARPGRPDRTARPGTGPSLLAPGAAHDPYRLYRVLREEYPLSYDAPLGAWLLSRHADVSTALTDPRFTGFPHDGEPRGGPAPRGLCHGGRLCLPRPQNIARPAATVPRHLSERVERTAYVLAHRIAGWQQADLVEEFCRWLPVGAAAPGASPDPAQPPGHPITPCTSRTGVRETALASFLANLLDAPDLLAALRIEPALAHRAWTESLRRDPPVQVVLRRTVAEVRVSGGTLPAWAPVACLIGAAGRDPERYAAPDLFDPFRTDQSRSTAGPESCPAVPLGRLEAEQGIRALLDAMPRLRWADGFRPSSTGLLTRGPRTLLVRPG
ncbi:cytochrome [Streptomyces sp. NPDC048496]|uniref:cytochrome n=1 Tax=Streptomyces sp. NPDC048496 TaxID=3365558 RepID=UPI003722B107